ncbi:MAG: hypothetical protein EB120_00845 [Proteobacteria bacterium]|nr:hypothetical protein [Pseudomonadota bacterium]
MSQCKVNKQNRDQIIAEYIDRTIDGMDIKGLIEYVRGGIETDLKHYSDTELEYEIIDQYDDFPWYDFDFIDE